MLCEKKLCTFLSSGKYHPQKEEPVPTWLQKCETKSTWEGSRDKFTCTKFILVSTDDHRRKNGETYLVSGYFQAGCYSVVKLLALLF